MRIRQAIAGTVLAAMVAAMLPSAPALADGRASTRNIILGIGAAAAATYLIIQHNKKVHAKYAADARRQAELQSENQDAWAAYRSEKIAFSNEAAEVADLEREVAYQHRVVVQQQHELALADRNGFIAPQVAVAPQGRSRRTVASRSPRSNAQSVAMVSYGWGQI